MITLLLTVVIAGFLVWMMVTYIPMPDLFRTLVIVIAAICVILYVLRMFGIADLPIPRVR